MIPEGRTDFMGRDPSITLGIIISIELDTQVG